ncbi:MAG: hypothetical protein JST89_00365 [Cyanobacteria bacterium SZAS-4]|nr:hypothetical protein [Cyanobacteria bacterium SZAS-4]
MVDGADGKIPHPDGKELFGQPKKLRKVAKTLLEQKNPSANLQSGSSTPVVGAASDAQRKFKKISRTMLEIDIEMAAQDMLLHTNVDNAESPNSVPKPANPRQAPSERFVAKTMLDHSMLFQAVSKSNMKMEQKAAEEAIERAKNPVEIVAPIVADRKVGNCQWSWADPYYGKERYRACAVCQAGVYDFTGLDREQAESIVFKRENSKKPKFYARNDGKFMIRECPKVAARKMQVLSLSALALGFIVSLIIALILVPPAPAPDLGHTATSPGAGTADVDKSSASSSGGSSDESGPSSVESGAATDGTSDESPLSTETTTLAPGFAHYENGKITRHSVRPSEQPATTTAPSNVALPDANEQGWQDATK